MTLKKDKTLTNYKETLANQTSTTTPTQTNSSNSSVDSYKNVASNLNIVNDTSDVGTTETSTQSNSTQGVNTDSTIDKYKGEIASQLASQNALNKDSSTYDSENNAINQKVASANTLLSGYLQNAQANQSSKAQAYIAQQNANKNLQNYLVYAGLQGQGVSESTMAQANQNYATQQNNINTSTASDNSNLYGNYLDVANEIDAQKNEAIANTQAVNSEYATTNITNATNVDELNTYWSEIESQYANGEISQADYNNIKTLHDKQETNLQLASYGVDDTTAVDIKTEAQNWSNKGGDQQSATDWITSLSSDDLANYGITNGTSVDMNVGKGTDIYVFYNGNWYKSTASKKGAGVLSVSDLYGKKVYSEIKNK